MASTGFGLPTSLLNRAAYPAIPPPPSFADFRFQSIGQQPSLLKRFSDPDPTQQSEFSSMSSETDRTPMDVEENAPSRNRPSLLHALGAGPRGTFDASTNHSNLTNQTSSPFSQLATVNSNVAPKPPLTASSPAFDSSAPNSNLSVYASSSKYSNALGLTQSSHAPSSPAPNGASDQPMSDVQPTRSPDRPLVPPATRRYETLRQIQTRLQAALPKIASPNLTSAMLLVGSAQQRTDRLYNEARHLHDVYQDLMHQVQQGQVAALHLIEAAEEAKGVTDGAKAELDRISSKEAVQQRNADANEVRGLIQAVEDWIKNQEAAEAEIRAKRVQQLKLKKQKQTPSITSSQSSPAAQSPLSVSNVGPLSANASTSKRPLFFSPTPEVDIKMEPTRSQPHPTAVMPSAELLRQRQDDLRKKLQEKRRSAEAESRAVSPSNVTQPGEPQFEAERRKAQDELKRKEEERKKEELKKKELERQQEEEHRRKEQAQREMVARKEAEKAREEELRKQREIEEAETKRRAEEERVARQAAQKEMENRAREQVEAEKKAKEVAEAQRKDAEARAAQSAEGREQAAAFLGQQKEAKDKLRQVPAEQRRRQSQEALDKQRRLAEEQARMRAEQEREDKLRQEQEIRRQQIQAEKNKTMVNRAQQIRAQRGHRVIPSQETTSEMSLDSSPQATNIVIPHSSVSPLEPRVPSYPGNLSRNPNTQSGPVASQRATNQPLSTSQPFSNGQKPVSSLHPVTPIRREISLPPVEHLSPTDSASSHPRSVPLSQPAISVYRHSSDGGNVPYREIATTSPQAQAANLKHLLNALNLPTINVSKVKPEPVSDDLMLSYPSEQSHGDVSVQSSSSQAQSVGRPSTAVRLLPPRVPSPIASQSGQSTKATNGSQTNAVVDRPVPSAVTDATLRARNHQVVSESSSNLQNNTNSRSERQDEALPIAPSNPARSESPFRMGPDTLEPRSNADEMLSTEAAYDTLSSQYSASSVPSAASQPPYRGRLPTSNSAPVHWDAYPPPAPKGANVYRPNYRERSRSPTAGMKRPRTPGSAPIIRDYRDQDERSVPMRRVSRSPPPRRPRRPSRSPSPFNAQDRPPLYARLDTSYRPDWRDSYPSRPDLLDRFTEPRAMAAPHAGRPGRGRGKRGRGGPPPTGPSHASLEQRISSTTLMSRLDDPPRRS